MTARKKTKTRSFKNISKASSKKAAPSGMLGRKKSPGVLKKKSTTHLKSVRQKAQALLDTSLSKISPSLRKKINALKSKVQVGDMLALGLKVFERSEMSVSVGKAEGSKKTKARKIKK